MAITRTEVREFETNNIVLQVVTITWLAIADGSVADQIFPDNIMRYLQGWFLIKADVDTGTTQPTALYDIAINNSAGDIMGGALSDLLAEGAQTNLAPLSGTDADFFSPIDNDPLTFALSGNSVNGASGTVKLYFTR